ncbi:hypothetical protein F4777DRAFT_541343 [Nemania sp. FL0916]|nr:hypothetical protein F4777DRAFT_541343 [Nemania sp. FL0916]
MCVPVHQQLTIHRLAPIIYTEEGARISEKQWRETMAEISFAKVEGISEMVRIEKK